MEERKTMREWLKDDDFRRLCNIHLCRGLGIALTFSVSFLMVCEFNTVLLIFISLFGAYELGAVSQMATGNNKRTKQEEVSRENTKNE